MHVIEHETDGIIADRMYLHDGHVTLTTDGLTLVGGVALHFSARTVDAEEFGRKREGLSGVEDDGECRPILAKPQFGRPGGLLFLSLRH